MEIGVSTASLFVRKNTEDALEYLSKNGVNVAEVFFSTYREYNKEFAELLNKRKGNLNVRSVHTLTTQFEPQLYSVNPRASQDSFEILEGVLQGAKTLGAKYYTFHGVARYKKTPMVVNYDKIGNVTQKIIDECSKYGVTLCYENVHWCIYNYKGFFKELKSRCPLLKATLDLKQANQSGVAVEDYIEDMSNNIETVHLMDYDKNGKLCLPGTGNYDFETLFKRLRDNGFDGACIIEAYNENYKNDCELIKSVEFLNEIKAKIF